MGKYQCLKNQRYQIDEYEIVSIREEDIQKIKDWRNAQIDILRQKKPLTENEQVDYYNNKIKNNFDLDTPDQILFSFLLDKKCIGYGGLVHIDWQSKESEISFLLDNIRILDKIQYQQDFIKFLSLISKVAFKDLKFNRLFTETYDIRPYHVLALEKFGFDFVKRKKKHNLINGNYVDSLIHEFMREKYVKK